MQNDFQFLSVISRRERKGGGNFCIRYAEGSLQITDRWQLERRFDALREEGTPRASHRGEETSHSHMKSQVWCSINPAEVPRGVREAPPARVTPLWRHAKVGRNTSASLTSLRVFVLCCCEWITRFVKEFVPRIYPNPL